MIRIVLFLASILCLAACHNESSDPQTGTSLGEAIFQPVSGGLDAYWYQGKAEVNRYSLEQNRYQDVHPGEAVLIFVTEDFRTDIQVKSEGANPAEAVSVLKTNFLRRFPTGLYDYSIMTSVFTPVEGEERRTFKVTMSSQDWCGQSFMQLNLEEDQYRVQLRSYFESEGDENSRVEAAVLEDELFNRIRIAPSQLPTGDFSLLPATSISRLRHLPFAPVKAEASLGDYSGSDYAGESLLSYRVSMPSLKRTLQIVFESEAPHRIVGWTDSYPSAFDGKVRTTRARLDETLVTPYWQKNDLADRTMRKKVGFGQVAE